MRTIRNRALAVCMAALLLIPGLAVSAEETPEAETVNEVEIPTAVSGGDAAVEAVNAEDMAVVAETSTEDQVMVYADDDIASGVDGNVTWVIDASGKLTVNETGDFSSFHGIENFAWKPYSSQIISAEINVSGMTDASYLFYGCSNMVSVNLENFDTSNVTNMWGMYSDCSSLTTLHSPCNVNNSVSLPFVVGTIWHLPDGTEVTELPQGLSYSVVLTRSDTIPQITTTTDDLNMDDVIRVKYVPYSYTVVTDNTDEENTVTFSIAEGTLAEGLQVYPATGEIYGVPLEVGEFKVTVMATYSNPEYPPSYAELTLIVLDNTDDNVDVATDPGYDITQPVADFNMDAISGEGTQTLVSQGKYAQFQHIVYIDGKPLEEGEGKDYTSEEGNTRITILNQTLADGGEGTHTLGIEFRTEDGTLKRAAQNYTVSSGGSEDDGGNDTPVDEGNGGQNPGNESGDDRPSAGNIPENSGNDSNIGKADSSNKDSGIDVIPIKKSLDEESIITVEYTVVSGDTLWSIAERFYGNKCPWTKIYEDNAEIIRDANKIYVGQVITIYLTEEQITSSSSAVNPEKSVTVDGETYVVQSGDSLCKIAVKFYDNGHQWRKIYETNQEVLRAPSKIYAGQVLVIPDR